MAIINGRGRVGIRKSAVSTVSIIMDGLKLYLDAGKTASYAGTGTVWTDLSGNGNTGTLTNGPVYNSSNGGSIAFDGTDDHIRLLTLNPYLNNVNKFTYETWIKVNNPASSTLQTVFSFGQSDLYNYDILIAITQNILVLQINNGADGSAVSSYSGATWNNISLVYDGLQTGNINRLKVYINGVLVVLNFSTYTVPSSTANGGYTNAGIGAYSTGNYYSNRFTGNISVSKLYNRVLSAAEVLQNYNALKSRFLPMTYSIVADGLKVHLDAGNLDSYYGAGTTWKDLSGNSINAALTNGPVYSSANSGSILLDGVDDSVVIPNSALFPSSAGSWSIWAYYSSSTNRMTLIQRHSSQSASGIVVTINGTGDNVGMQIYSSNVSQSVLSIATSAAALNKNRWNNITITFDSTNPANIYVNGVLSASGTPTGAWSFNSQSITLGTSPDTFWTKYAGNVSDVQIYSRALSALEVQQNYSALLSRYYPIVSDSDAQAFVVAAGLTSSTQAAAVNTLVTSLKSAGIWTKMKAVYPMVGGNAVSHKFNLKDPRDLNAAYRLTFTAAWVHSSTGAKPNGTSDYADTNLFISSSGLGQDSLSVAYYSRTNIAGNADFGLNAWASHYTYGYIRTVANKSQSRMNTSGPEAATPIISDSLGLFVFNRNSSSAIGIYKNGVINSLSQVSSGLNSTGKFVLGAMYANAWNYGNKECSFFSIGNGLTDAEATSLYTAVQAYQTALGRQV